MWRQFDPRNPIDHSRPRELELEEAAVVDGFSGASYYHWLCETVPRLLILGEHLEKTRPNNAPRVPVLLPAGGPHLEATLRLLGRAAFSAFGVLHKREHGTVVRVSQKVFALTWGNDDHPGAASALLPAAQCCGRPAKPLSPQPGGPAARRGTPRAAARPCAGVAPRGRIEGLGTRRDAAAGKHSRRYSALWSSRYLTGGSRRCRRPWICLGARRWSWASTPGLANALFCVEGAGAIGAEPARAGVREYAHLAGPSACTTRVCRCRTRTSRRARGRGPSGGRVLDKAAARRTVPLWLFASCPSLVVACAQWAPPGCLGGRHRLAPLLAPPTAPPVVARLGSSSRKHGADAGSA